MRSIRSGTAPRTVDRRTRSTRRCSKASTTPSAGSPPRSTATGLTDRTVILFTSDNGGLATREGPNTPATINSPLREGKGWLYEGGLRVPLIVRWPGKVKPGSEPTPAWAADLVPTIAALAGLPEPEGIDGRSLAGLLTEGKPLESRPLFWHYPHYANQNSRPGGAVRDGDWKLVEFFEGDRRELYNPRQGPVRETTNLAGQASRQGPRAPAEKLVAWRSSGRGEDADAQPRLRAQRPASPDGSITLPASTADVHGVMLRYEPLPHKNTVGYWVRPDDRASWEFDVKKPGDVAS